MPKYRVKNKGFYDGKTYDPNGKRNFIFTDKPLKPVPSWVEPVKAETPSEKKKRLATEKKAAIAAEKKAAEDKQAVEDLTFMGDGEASTGVETL